MCWVMIFIVSRLPTATSLKIYHSVHKPLGNALVSEPKHRVDAEDNSSRPTER